MPTWLADSLSRTYKGSSHLGHAFGHEVRGLGNELLTNLDFLGLAAHGKTDGETVFTSALGERHLEAVAALHELKLKALDAVVAAMRDEDATSLKIVKDALDLKALDVLALELALALDKNGSRAGKG